MAIQYATAENFDALVANGVVIADFYSTTCNPCKLLARFLEDLVADMPFVEVVKVNTTDYPALKERFDIRAVPTVHFYKDGELRETHLGLMSPDELRQQLGALLYE